MKLSGLLLLPGLLNLTACYEQKPEEDIACAQIAVLPASASSMLAMSYYYSDQIFVQVPIARPAEYRITSSLGSVYDTCEPTGTYGISPQTPYDVTGMAFNEYSDYGLNLPDKISYEIKDLGDCADATDDTVMGDYQDLRLHWQEYTYYDQCYGYETRRAAFIDIYLP